jgi:hypothetical protein
MSEHWSAAGRWSYCRSERYRVIDGNAPISPRQCGMISLLAAWRKLAAFPWSPCSPSQAYFWNVGMLGTQHLSTSQQLAKNYEGTMWAWTLSFLLLVWLIFFNLNLHWILLRLMWGMIVRGLVWSTRRQDGRWRKILVRGNTELRGWHSVQPTVLVQDAQLQGV